MTSSPGSCSTGRIPPRWIPQTATSCCARSATNRGTTGKRTSRVGIPPGRASARQARACWPTMWDDMSSSADQQYCAGNLDRGPGIYPLRVMIEHSDTQKGRNKYSLRVNTSGPKPYIYGIGDIGIYANVEEGGTTEFYLAEVGGDSRRQEPHHRAVGSGGHHRWQQLGPRHRVRTASATSPDCSWSATNGDSGRPRPMHVVTTGGKVFNGHLVTMVVAIPEDYTCSGDDCWFKINAPGTSTTYPSGEVHDSTTWAAYIEGNPIWVRLVSSNSRQQRAERKTIWRSTSCHSLDALRRRDSDPSGCVTRPRPVRHYITSHTHDHDQVAQTQRSPRHLPRSWHRPHRLARRRLRS